MAKYDIKDMNETVERGEYESLLEGNMQHMYNLSPKKTEDQPLNENTDESLDESMVADAARKMAKKAASPVKQYLKKKKKKSVVKKIKAGD